MYNEIMVSFKTRKKKGNVTIILIGLISIMILMSFALSRRMSGHSQLLTLSDYTQISRYFLESYAGDVLRQINTEANKLDSQVFKSFREKAKNGKFDSSFYKPSPMLTELAKELDISFSSSPSIRCLGVEALTYPKSFYCPPIHDKKEKIGTIELLCKATFRKKEYTLRVQYPFKVVLRMTPVIKDFVLFVDQISKEQGHNKIGSDDCLNIMYSKHGVHPEIIDSSIIALAQGIKVKPGTKYRPFMLLPPPDASEKNKPELCGKVYLGHSKDMVYLNLAGNTIETNTKSTSELFLISPSCFKVAQKNTDFLPVSVFPKTNNSYNTIKGMDIKLKHNHHAKMGILGFSHGITPKFGTIFSNSTYKPSDFFNSGSNASEFFQKLEGSNEGYMAFSSGLKLMGLDYPDLGISARKVYGNVLARFFVLTFWWPPKNGVALQYDANRLGNDFPDTPNYAGTKYHFKPLIPGQTYQDFMSRMVSGYQISPGNNLPDGFMAYNSTQSSEKKIFTYKEGEFHSSDGFKATRPFDELGRDWFGKDTRPESNPNSTAPEIGIEQRITRAYQSGKAFLKDAQSKGRFDVNGVIYVKGPLEMPTLKMSSDKIGGGVILVDGPIKLKNITRGHVIDTDNPNFDYPALYQKLKTEITQENFLTFVSLSGDPITIEEETLLGVHLINLNKGYYTSPYSQIKWTNRARKEILFCGGIACNFLDLPERLEEFGKVRNPNKIIGAPYFMYHSAMAAAEPSMAAQMIENMRGYKLTSKSVSK